MALSAALASTWNPLRVTGTSMPGNVLLMCKIIAIAALTTRHFRILPDPFLPFFEPLDVFHGSAAFRIMIQTIFVGSAVLLLFNRWVRVTACLLGCCFLLAVISSKAYYGNNKTLCGLLLVFAAFADAKRPDVWFRPQLALVYFGAALNKLLDPDWQSGVFFDFWANDQVRNGLYQYFAQALPPFTAGMVMCWLTIAIEFALAALVLVPRFTNWAVWLNLLFQIALLEFAGNTFTLFFYAMTAASWALIQWPDKLLVIYDGDCGFCDFSRRTLLRVDYDQVLEFEPYQSGVGAQYGLSDEVCNEKLQLVHGSTILSGYQAFRRMLFFWAPLWMGLTIGLALLPDGWPKQAYVAFWLALLGPWFIPIGEMGYAMVARNRHRLMPGSTCGLENRPKPKK